MQATQFEIMKNCSVYKNFFIFIKVLFGFCRCDKCKCFLLQEYQIKSVRSILDDPRERYLDDGLAPFLELLKFAMRSSQTSELTGTICRVALTWHLNASRLQSSRIAESLRSRCFSSVVPRRLRAYGRTRYVKSTSLVISGAMRNIDTVAPIGMLYNK